MELPVRVLAQTIGPRVAKTGLAVFIAVAVLHYLQPAWAAMAGVAAFLGVQPTLSRARETLRHQLLSTALAAAVGIPLGRFLGPVPVAEALGVVLLLGLGPRLGLGEAVSGAVITLIFLLDRPDQDYVLYSLGRVAAILLGTLVGYLVNVLLLRPDFAARARAEIGQALARTDAYVARVLASLPEPESYQKAEIKADARGIEELLSHARYYQQLHQESAADPASERLRKVINTLFVFMERTMDLHKLALQAGGLHGEALARVERAVAALTVYRNRVLPLVAEGKAPAAEEGEPFRAALADLRRLVDGLVADPATRAEGLHLHSIASLLEYMGWRVDSALRLGRG